MPRVLRKCSNHCPSLRSNEEFSLRPTIRVQPVWSPTKDQEETNATAEWCPGTTRQQWKRTPDRIRWRRNAAQTQQDHARKSYRSFNTSQPSVTNDLFEQRAKTINNANLSSSVTQTERSYNPTGPHNPKKNTSGRHVPSHRCQNWKFLWGCKLRRWHILVYQQASQEKHPSRHLAQMVTSLKDSLKHQELRMKESGIMWTTSVVNGMKGL